MINTILCILIGHKLHHKGEFRVVEQSRPFNRFSSNQHYANVFRCFRCGCEVKRGIKS